MNQNYRRKAVFFFFIAILFIFIAINDEGTKWPHFMAIPVGNGYGITPIDVIVVISLVSGIGFLYKIKK